MEIFYCVWRVEGELKGEAAYKLCLSLPIEIIHESAELLAHAARIKAENRLSLADSWIAATAQLKNATLVHKDPEFSSLPLKQKVLPLKTASR
jgi:ribonuclease VapC